MSSQWRQTFKIDANDANMMFSLLTDNYSNTESFSTDVQRLREKRVSNVCLLMDTLD